MYYWFLYEQKYILSSIHNVIPIYSVCFVPTNMSAWALSIHTSRAAGISELAYYFGPMNEIMFRQRNWSSFDEKCFWQN